MCNRDVLARTLIALSKEGFFLRESLSHYFNENIMLDSIDHKNFGVRLATLQDLPYLLDLEAACWGSLQVSIETIKTRLDLYPEGQWVATVLDGAISKVVGVIYSQTISSYKPILEGSIKFTNQHILHSSNSSILQLLVANNLFVIPQIFFLLSYCRVLQCCLNMVIYRLVRPYAM